MNSAETLEMYYEADEDEISDFVETLDNAVYQHTTDYI